MMIFHKTIRLTISVIWVVLFILLLQRDFFISAVTPSEELAILEAEREEYQGVYFRKNKIGYVINHYVPTEDGGLAVDQKAHMNLNVGELVHTIDLHLKATLDQGNALQSFSFDFSSPFYKMNAEGYVEDKTIVFTLTTGNNTVKNRLLVEGAPMVPTARRGYLLQPVPEVGEKRKVPWFDPVSLTAKNSIIEYRGKERVHIHGRVNNLHRFIENYGGARISLWLNDEGDVVKEESPAGFIFLKEPKFRAMSLEETGEELLSAVAVKVTGTMPELNGLSSMRYRLGIPEGEQFDELSSGRQQFEEGIVTISLEDVDKEGGGEQSICSREDKSLLSSPYIQADAKQIEKLAVELVGGELTGKEAIRILSNWVYENIEKRPVLGIPDALTTLDNLRGDCNEHAALFAALARNRGIPTKIAAGVVFHKGAFYYHAWNEVCVDDRWISIDTTTNQFPADLSHIKFIEGDLDEQVKIGALLGRLTIEPLASE